jgi:hypothetical protein
MLNDPRAMSDSERFLDFARNDNKDTITQAFLPRNGDLLQWRYHEIDF